MLERAWIDRDGVEWKVRLTRSFVTQEDSDPPEMQLPTQLTFWQEFGGPIHMVDAPGLLVADLREMDAENLQRYLDAARTGGDA